MRRREGGEEEKEDQVVVVQPGVDGEPGTGESQDDGAEQHQDALVGPVAHGTTPERTRDEERQLDEAREPDPQARVRLAVDLKGHGDDRQVTAE